MKTIAAEIEDIVHTVTTVQWCSASGRAYFTDIFTFLDDETERAFAEAALRAVRAMLNGKADAVTVALLDRVISKKSKARERVRGWYAERIHRAGSRQVWQAQRQRIFLRDNNTCQDCGARPDKLYCSHRDPAGNDDDSNLLTRCGHCHAVANPRLVAEHDRQRVPF